VTVDLFRIYQRIKFIICKFAEIRQRMILIGNNIRDIFPLRAIHIRRDRATRLQVNEVSRSPGRSLIHPSRERAISLSVSRQFVITCGRPSLSKASPLRLIVPVQGSSSDLSICISPNRNDSSADAGTLSKSHEDELDLDFNQPRGCDELQDRCASLHQD